MATLAHHAGEPRSGDQIVRAPRPGDALGHALRGVYGDVPLPADILMLLRRLDRAN